MNNSGLDRWALFEYGFRPFFLGAGLFAVLVMLMWLFVLHGENWPGGPSSPLLWHAHEMLFGFVGAALAGFLLTAVANWTGRVPISGKPLAVLAGAWLAGRLAMAFSGWLHPGVVAVIDLAFLVILVVMVAREVTEHGSRSHYPLVGIIGLLVIANGLTHIQALGDASGVGMIGITLGIHLMLLLVAVIGGRVVPAFTRNWLRQHDGGAAPVSRIWVERAAIAFTVLVGLADSFGRIEALTGILALAVAVAHGIRLSGWRGARTMSEPLLAVLHLGYGWLVVGYMLLGFSMFFGMLPRSAALHALTVGAMGTMILAIMSRAALGHTGRVLRASRQTAIAYLLVSLAALLRIGAVLAPSFYTMLIGASALAWIAAFTLFCVGYWPILTRPRVDQEPGSSGGLRPKRAPCAPQAQ